MASHRSTRSGGSGKSGDRLYYDKVDHQEPPAQKPERQRPRFWAGLLLNSIAGVFVNLFSTWVYPFLIALVGAAIVLIKALAAGHH